MGSTFRDTQKKSYYCLKMNEKVIALIDMDCFYVQVANVTIPHKRHNLKVKPQPLQGGGTGKACSERGSSCGGSGGIQKELQPDLNLIFD